MIKKTLVSVGLFLTPMLMVFAQGANGTQGVTFQLLYERFQGFLASVPVILVAIGFVVFLGAGIKVAMNPDDDNKKRFMWAGFVLFAMVSIWGLVKILQGVVGVGSGVELERRDVFDLVV